MKLFAILLFLPLTALAQISDPNGILDKTDAFLRNIPFEAAFKPGDQITFSFRECTLFGCPKKVSLTTAKVEPGKDGGLAVNQYGAAGDWFSTEPVTTTDWESIHRNYLRAKIGQAMGAGYTIEMQSMTEMPCPAPAQGKCLKITFRAQNGIKMYGDYEYVIQSSNSAIAQIVSYVQNEPQIAKRRLEYTLVTSGQASRN